MMSWTNYQIIICDFVRWDFFLCKVSPPYTTIVKEKLEKIVYFSISP